MDNIKTVREWIDFVEQQFNNAELFYGHGTDNAAEEAFYLVMVVVGLDFDCEESKLDDPVLKKNADIIEKYINRRIVNRVPVAYQVNKAWFAGHCFYVDERVLVPRSPIAELINNHFRPWKKPENIKSILDIGTGSACIPIACAYAFTDLKIDAVDIDVDALDVAKININQHKLDQRINIYKSDVFEKLRNKKYDIIISNPPYIGEIEMLTLPKEYEYEPTKSLKADDNGLAVVEKILRQAGNYLYDDGILIVEVGSNMNFLIERYPDLPFIWLDFENGGEGVFLLNKSDLVEYFFIKPMISIK